SMIPIYEQIVEAIRKKIIVGELRENDALPSVRVLSRELRISALTVKKAYDVLEQEGLTATVHGKGTYVKAPNPEALQEERRREIETELDALVQKAKRYEITAQEIYDMLGIIMEE
ncbi:MAG: GntR family transcriptional regulator, partial [Oscillospiraceae bacterium]|nr:GntR family transcriptional regulator [Oscillospiraceae bacterium]